MFWQIYTLLWFDVIELYTTQFTHIHQGYFTGTGAIIYMQIIYADYLAQAR